MDANFDAAFSFSMKWEGYKSEDPDDPGGRTIFGISSKTWPLLVEELWDLPKEQALAKAKDFYKKNYWDAASCGTARYPIDVALFDATVNLGVPRAVAIFKKSTDGADFLMRRMKFYLDLNKPKFLHGWINRVVDLYFAVTRRA